MPYVRKVLFVRSSSFCLYNLTQSTEKKCIGYITLSALYWNVWNDTRFSLPLAIVQNCEKMLNLASNVTIGLSELQMLNFYPLFMRVRVCLSIQSRFLSALLHDSCHFKCKIIPRQLRWSIYGNANTIQFSISQKYRTDYLIGVISLLSVYLFCIIGE